MSETPIRDAAQLVDLPAKALLRLKKDGIIGDPVSDADMRGLAMIRHIWGHVWFIRCMLAPLSLAYRRKICLEPELSRAERYALTCYLNAKPEERIQVKDIIGKVKHYLNATLTEEQVARVRVIAYDIRRGRRLDPRHSGETIPEIAE